MEYEFIKSSLFIIIGLGINIILLILYFITVFKLKKINKKYNLFMKKLGNGNNIDEILHKYIKQVEEVELANKEIINYCNKLEQNISECVQKIGMVRYSAFKDTGSDLSFALALLNNNDDGIILNGIYSREMSNIYAKQVIKGKANNKLSEEETEALNKAINS